MCVTNTTGRRPLPVSINPALVSFCPSVPQRPPACSVASAPVKPVSLPVASFAPAAVYYQQQFPVLSNQSVHDEKARPKRRRKPQKPGKTAKNNDRHFVVHEYHDHSMDQECNDQQQDDSGDESYRKRGGVVSSFPVKLHEVLDQVVEDGLDHVVSWAQHGRCFAIHRPKEFVDYVMPK
jgi:HSF-type DNA-binding